MQLGPEQLLNSSPRYYAQTHTALFWSDLVPSGRVNNVSRHSVNIIFSELCLLGTPRNPAYRYDSLLYEERGG